MEMPMKSVFAVMALAMAAAASAAYPDKPIRLVIGSAAGSGPDITSRVMADRLYGVWNQRIVVDPRPGVAGILSAEIVTRSAADGYTWMMLTSQLLVASNVFKDHKINLARDFASVSLIGTVPFVLSVHPSVAKTIPELIEVAKKSQPPLRYGSAGTGATEHLSAFLFTRMTNTNMLHVPYKGIGQAIADTMSREVHLTYAALPAVLPMVQSGRLRALGVTTRKRATLLPDVPAVAEAVPGYENYGWYSIVVPTGVPKDIIAKISAEVVKAVKEPAFGERLKDIGIEAVGSSVGEFDAFRADQTRRISEIVKALGTELK
jgi:tripartite-type tricarboxylate transporter receptor subunit TctC